MTEIMLPSFPRFWDDLVSRVTKEPRYPDLDNGRSAMQYWLKQWYDIDVEICNTDARLVVRMKDEDATLFLLRWS